MILTVHTWILLYCLRFCKCAVPDQFLSSSNLSPRSVQKRSWDTAIDGAFRKTASDVTSRRKRSLPNAEDSKTALDRHNYYRSVIGDEGEEPIPSNMKYMSWDPALSITSLIYAKKCIFLHSTAEERSTKDFPVGITKGSSRQRLDHRFSLQGWNGENLWAGRGKFAGNRFNPEVGIESWYMEYLDYDFYDKYCVPGKQCGHYTQVVWANTYKLGCAWVNCSTFDTTEGEIWSDAAYMVCHYAPGGNSKEEYLYKVGERCEDCHPNDTCPDGRLCRNPERDKVLPGPSDAGHIASLVMTAILLTGLVVATAIYILLHIDDFCTAWVFLKKKTKIGNSGDIPERLGGTEGNRNGNALPLSSG